MAKLAEEMLSQARESLADSDLDGAYDYADQSIKEAGNAKTAYRDIVDIAYQAGTIIGTARQFGSLHQLVSHIMTELKSIKPQFTTRVEEFLQGLVSLLHPHRRKGRLSHQTNLRQDLIEL